MPLSVHCKYFLVPSSWISKWRNYISPPFKNLDKPETLDGVIDSLMCEKVYCYFTLQFGHFRSLVYATCLICFSYYTKSL